MDNCNIQNAPEYGHYIEPTLCILNEPDRPYDPFSLVKIPVDSYSMAIISGEWKVEGAGLARLEIYRSTSFDGPLSACTIPFGYTNHAVFRKVIDTRGWSIIVVRLTTFPWSDVHLSAKVYYALDSEDPNGSPLPPAFTEGCKQPPVSAPAFSKCDNEKRCSCGSIVNANAPTQTGMYYCEECVSRLTLEYEARIKSVRTEQENENRPCPSRRRPFMMSGDLHGPKL